MFLNIFCNQHRQISFTKNFLFLNNLLRHVGECRDLRGGESLAVVVTGPTVVLPVNLILSWNSQLSDNLVGNFNNIIGDFENFVSNIQLYRVSITIIIIESNQHYGLRGRYQCLCEVDHQGNDGENDK